MAVTANHNIPEYSVSELSTAVKKTLEGQFNFVRVKGEISGLKRAASGHVYLSLKDESALIEAVCWRGISSRLPLKPEDGLEVICTGKITTYAGRSRYQLVIESMELAGEGALLKMIEQRKKQLQAEGLFDQSRKKILPFLPQRIGVITSPTGAVIKDILHRIKERFPRNVILWPVLVQGEGAREQITQALEGFNKVPDKIKPDLLILARGGGSLEDLMAFNEESVVRAVAASEIPIISAVGHETDWTLVDFAADYRAPTPTGAAEKAVPVKDDLILLCQQYQLRLSGFINRFIQNAQVLIEKSFRGLPKLETIIIEKAQKLDDRYGYLLSSINTYFERKIQSLKLLQSALPHPLHYIEKQMQNLLHLSTSLKQNTNFLYREGKNRLSLIANSLRPKDLKTAITEKEDKTKQSFLLLTHYIRQLVDQRGQELSFQDKLLDSFSFKRTLERGFAWIQDEKGKIIDSKAKLSQSSQITINLKDGCSAGQFTLNHKKISQKKGDKKMDNRQGDLFS